MTAGPPGVRDVSGAEDEVEIDVQDVADRVLGMLPLVPRRADVTVCTMTSASVRRRRRRLIVLVDVVGGPAAVAKLPLSRHDPKLAYEYEVLSRFPSRFPVPAVLGRIGNGFAMSYLPGVDLPDVPGLAVDRNKLRTVLGRTVDRMADLHRLPVEEASARTDPHEAAAQYVPDPWFGVPYADRALERALVAPTHGDLGPWNVRVDGPVVRVLDLEDYRPAGIAAMDVLNLVLTCALTVFPEYPRHGFDWLYDRAFGPDHWFRDIMIDAVRRYAGSSGQRASQILDLTPLTCLWLIERVVAQGRDASQMFYRTFAERYLDRRPTWVGDLDD
jgi:hypothetical protein